jgi:hypothetical protein
MSNETKKANELISIFGKDLAIKVVDEIIKSSPSLPILGDAGLFGEDIELSTDWWRNVRNEILKGGNK